MTCSLPPSFISEVRSVEMVSSFLDECFSTVYSYVYRWFHYKTAHLYSEWSSAPGAEGCWLLPWKPLCSRKEAWRQESAGEISPSHTAHSSGSLFKMIFVLKLTCSKEKNGFIIIFKFLKLNLLERDWLIQLFRFQVYNSTTRHLYSVLCSPPQVKSPSITIYPPLPSSASLLPSGNHHTVVCVHESFSSQNN